MTMDVEAIRREVERQVLQYFHVDTAPAPRAGLVTGTDVIAHLEHSLLNPDTTLEKIKAECAVARKYSVAAVCVAPYYVPAAREELLGSPVAVGTAVGFPHGCMSQAAKLASIASASSPLSSFFGVIFMIFCPPFRLPRLLREKKAARAGEIMFFRKNRRFRRLRTNKKAAAAYRCRGRLSATKDSLCSHGSVGKGTLQAGLLTYAFRGRGTRNSSLASNALPSQFPSD